MWGLSLVPILYYFVVLVRYAWNMPYMDDYPVLVEFLNRWLEADSATRLDVLLEQNNFHRVVWVKVLALLNVGVTGTINFTFLQFVGNAALLLTAWLLYQSSTHLSRWAFLPVLFLLFQFQSWNNAFWAMAAVSNLWAPAWALLAFWLATRPHVRLQWLALLVGLVALLTNGNGIVVLPLLCIVLWIGPTSYHRATVQSVLLTLLALYLYFRGYHNPSGPALTNLLTPTKLMHLFALDTAFLGAMFYHPAIAWLSQGVGAVTIFWTLYLILTRYDQKNPTLFWFVVFLHLTGLMLAVNRIEKGTELMYASRYRNITALMLATTWLTMAEVVQIARSPTGRGPTIRFHWQTILTRLVLLGSLGIWTVSNYTYASKIVRFRELKQTDQFLWQQFGEIRGCAPALQPAAKLTQLNRHRLFLPPTLPLDQLVSTPLAVNLTTSSADSVDYRLDISKRVGAYFVISGWAKLRGRKANFNNTFVGVQESTGWRLYTTLFHQRLDLSDSVNEKDTGFTAILPVGVSSKPLRVVVQSGGTVGFADITLLNE